MQQLELEKMIHARENLDEQPRVVPGEKVAAVVVELMAKAMLAVLRQSSEEEVGDE